ncbi:hypothetical protein R1flu_022381 [Riccia fluitans]|uniref:SP-RING-type domain-containing protein n=1 Tax=Riccia fluitans TaxID=41844 RepID=A0ABD1ZS23_9MARC
MAHAGKMSSLLELLHRRLQEGFEGTRPIDKKDLVNHLLQISRAIDHAVASNQRPASPQRCLEMFKIITRLKDDDIIKPSMMVFLLAVKGACRAGWFKAQEADELSSLYDQLLMHFQLDGNCSRQLTATGSIQEENLEIKGLITSVCQRYCPRIKLGSVIVSFTTKKEYETRGCDFIVAPLAPKTKLSLFVVHTENTETSACLVTPNSLSFILNGRGVERRSSLQNCPELGPQMPTDVMHLLRLGNNFIQVVGESPGKYMVAIAATSITPYSSSSVELAEYVAPSTEGDTIDDEVVEAGSRISLRCPISHKRIITPVKGLLCKHHQCFDFDSYIDMNELRPVWRCPCCNSTVSCVQLRLDNRMKQILKDVDEKCFEAIINQDGTWMPAQSSDEQKDVNIARGITHIGSGAQSKQFSGLDVTTSESGIIELSDDDEMKEPAVSVEKIMPPRVHPFTTTGSNNSEGPEDRKPDIRAASGVSISQSAELVGFSSRERTNTSTGCSPLDDASGQLGVPNNPSGDISDSNAGVRYMQNPPPTTHLWSGGNVSMHGSTVQQTGNMVSSLDRNVYVPAGGSPSLPGGNQTFVHRPRSLSQSVVAGGPASGGFMTSTSHTHSGHLSLGLVGSAQVIQQHDIHQHQSLDLLRQMQLNSSSYRAPVDMSHRMVSRDGVGQHQGTVMTDQGLTRQVHTEQFGSETEQSSQTCSQPGHLNMSRQDCWQSQRVTQLQQSALSNANPRMGGGRSSTVTLAQFVSPSMEATAGAQQGPSSRITPRAVNTGDGSHMSNASALTSVHTPAGLNWRPAGRMRGSVSGSYLPGNRIGVNSAALQPGPVNRARASAAPNTTTSIPVSNSIITSPTIPDALLSSGETLQDVIWLPTLGADQVDIGGTQVESWFNETPIRLGRLFSSKSRVRQLAVESFPYMANFPCAGSGTEKSSWDYGMPKTYTTPCQAITSFASSVTFLTDFGRALMDERRPEKGRTTPLFTLVMNCT